MDLNAIFAEQDGIVTRQQAIDAGMSRSSISRRVTSGEWCREAQCVYRRSDVEVTPRTALRVAVYSAGDSAISFGPSAAWWHGLVDRTPTSHWVNVPVNRAVGFEPRRRVRRRDVRREDVVTLRGLRVTSLPLTVLETAALLPDGQSFLNRSLQLNHVAMDSLIGCYRRNSRRSDAPTMARMLARAAEAARSAGEQRLTVILRQAGLDGWVTQVRALGYVLGFAFVRQRLAIEIDGGAQDNRFGADRKRQQVLTNGGWTVLRYTERQLIVSPREVAAEIRAALELSRAC